MRSKWAPIIEAFNASQSDVTVQFVPLVDDLLEGIQPDDIASRATKADTTIVWAITDTNAGYLRDLQPLMDIDSQYNPGDFWQAANEGCTDALGNKGGLPTTLVPSLIYYDKQAFELAGIYLPQPGWTWTDFKTTVTQLNQFFSGQRFAFADSPFKSILESYVIENLKQNFGGLDSTRLENDVKWYVELVQQGAIYPVSPDDFSNISNSTYLAWQSPFQSDNPPVIWMGSIKATYPEFSIDPAAVSMDTSPFTHLALDRYGVLPLPTGEFNENQNTNPSDAMDCVVMSAGSRNIQASWKWISYLSNFWYGKNDSLLPNQYTAPVKLTLADSQGYWNVLPSSSVASVRFALEHSFDVGKAYYPQLQVVYKALQGVFDGQNTLNNALAQAKSQIQQLPPARVQEISPFEIDSDPAMDISSENITTITFFANTAIPAELNAIRLAIDEFNLNNEAEIKVHLATEFPEAGEGYFNNLSKAYDCYLSQTDAVNALMSEQVLSLNTWFEADDTLRHDYSPEIVTSSMINGLLMSLQYSSITRTYWQKKVSRYLKPTSQWKSSPLSSRKYLI